MPQGMVLEVSGSISKGGLRKAAGFGMHELVDGNAVSPKRLPAHFTATGKQTRVDCLLHQKYLSSWCFISVYIWLR